MPKKILIITPFYLPNIGGAETFTHQLVQEAKKWFAITVLTFQPLAGQAKTYEENYYKRGYLKIYRMRYWIKFTHVWKGLGLKNILSIFPQMFVTTLFHLTKGKYDIIHAQGLISGLIAVLLKKVFKVKVF